jgi:hypothetical protein
MDAAEFLQALPDLAPILGDDEDARQDVLLRLWDKRGSIRNMPNYARRAAKRAASDASKRRNREDTRFVPFEVSYELALESESPLDAMMNTENRQRFWEAVPRLPPCQRDSVVWELDLARQSGEIEAKPPAKSHRSNFYKATKTLMKLLASDNAQDVCVAALELGQATSRRRAASSTSPSEPSTVPVAPSTTTKQGTTRAQEGSTAAVDPSTTTIDPLAVIVGSSTSLVEPPTTIAGHLTTSGDRSTASIDRTTAAAPQPRQRFRSLAGAAPAENRVFRVADRRPARNEERNMEYIRLQREPPRSPVLFIAPARVPA